jgi:acyl-CoA synthetase (NDP forming)
MPANSLEEILHPKSIAVVGASGSGGRGGGFVNPLLQLGFKGEIYPVNPRYSEISGLKAYPSLKEVPGSVDYVISAVPAPVVLAMLDDASQRGVKGIHLFTARFSETGRTDAAELEQAILRTARTHGIRIIGPNCMGLYYPSEGISWSEDFPKKSGLAGLASQSGNVASEIVQTAVPRGIYFSKVISYGNAIDFNESDYLEYFAQDPETKIILMYIEGVKDGRRFFKSLRQAASCKPVVVLKGGRGKAGARAAASHTASLAGAVELWETVVSQAGAIFAESLSELIDLAASFYFLPQITGRRVGVAGGAGGASVLAADECEKAGLDVISLPAELREELKNRGVAIWDWIGNPADISIRVDDDFTAGYMLEIMSKYPHFDFLIPIMRRPDRRYQKAMSVDSYLEEYKLKESSRKPLLAVLADRERDTNDDDDAWRCQIMRSIKAKLIASSIPFYPTIGRAARAADKFVDYCQERR